MTRANVSDRDGASAMIALHAMHLRQVQNVLVDGGYSGVNFQLDVASNLNATVQVAKRNELHRFEVMPQRWVVERSFSWLENCRRLWKNCERQLTTSLQMVVLAFLALYLRDFRQLLIKQQKRSPTRGDLQRIETILQHHLTNFHYFVSSAYLIPQV
jgi:transposase